MFHLRPVFTEVGSELSRAPGSGVLLNALKELLSRDQLARERERVRVVIVLLLGIFEVLEGVFEVAVVDGAFAVRLINSRRSFILRLILCQRQLWLSR